MLVDTHSHIYDEAFDDDREQVVQRAREAGVSKLLLPAIDRDSYGAMIALARLHPDVCYPMMGLHPTSVNGNSDYERDLETVAAYFRDPPSGIRFCAVGEVGLDLHWEQEFLPQQQHALRFQIELALRYDLPLVVHTRDAWNEMCALLADYRGSGLRGVMHSFGGTEEHYRLVRSCGDFLFGIGGPVTYKKSPVAGMLPSIPPDEIVLETDSPYLPPVPHRGRRNESAYVALVRDRVAEIYGIASEEVERITTDNVRRMFGESIFS